jgi:hypothetical protein
MIEQTPSCKSLYCMHRMFYCVRQVSSALPFVPMSVESSGRLGTPTRTLLGDLADQAVQAGGPGLSRAALPFAGETRPCVVRARTSRRMPLAASSG